MEMWGVSLAWGQVNSLAKRFAGGNGRRKKLCIVPYHNVIFMQLAETMKLGEGRGFKSSIWLPIFTGWS